MLGFFGLIFAGLSASPYDDSAPDGALLVDLSGGRRAGPASRARRRCSAARRRHASTAPATSSTPSTAPRRTTASAPWRSTST
jgi:hypothetical protein